MSDINTKRVRLLLNLVSYLKNHPGVLLCELAETFRMDEQEMEVLLLTEVIASGVPPYSPSDYLMVFINDGPVGKTVTLHQHEQFRRPLKLTAAEAMALKTILEGYTRAGGDEVRAVADSLLEKVSGAMLGNRGLARDTRSLALVRQTESMQERLQTIDQAVASRRKLEISYFSAAHGKLGHRKVCPLALFEEGSRFYLRAWCESRGAERSFRVDRIRDLETLDQTFDPQIGRKSRKRPQAVPGWDGTAPKGELAVRFEPYWAEDIEQEWAPRNARVEHQTDGSLVLRIPLYSAEWALGWVLSFGPHAELLEPEYLREELVNRIELMRDTLK